MTGSSTSSIICVITKICWDIILMMLLVMTLTLERRLRLGGYS